MRRFGWRKFFTPQQTTSKTAAEDRGKNRGQVFDSDEANVDFNFDGFDGLARELGVGVLIQRMPREGKKGKTGAG